MSIFKLSRRTVLTTLAGGTAIVGGAGLWLGVERLREARFRRPVDRPGFSPNVFLGIQEDGSVEIWLTRSEMGQGVSTALPMLIAEELDADWRRVSVHQAEAGSAFDYGQLFTAASSSVSSLWIELRRAGAVAREMLVGAAAEIWDVSVEVCSTRDGYVYAAGERLGYGELAATAARQWVPIRPRLKHQDAFSLIGQSPARLDIPAKVAGSTRYGADVTLPGMLHAVVLRPPVAGQAGVIRDEAACRAVPGVRDVFAIDEGIAVVAAGTFAALEGRARLDVEWAAPTSAPVNGQSLQAALEAALAGSGRVVAGSGEAVDQPSHSASYFAPFLAHACMEPMNCTVSIANGGCQIWVGTQDPHGARAVAAQAAGMDPGAVVVHVLPLGGGFGRRAGQDFVREAVQIARRMKAPVQLLWTREDDLGHGRYREAVGVRTSARVDGAGRPRQVEHFVASAVPHASVVDPGIGPLMGADSPIYAFDSATVRWAGVPVPIPTTIWRSVGYSYNTFAIECFIDELAARAGADPLTFRLGLLPDGSPVARCIEQVAALCRWTEADGRFLGMSAYQFAQTSVAMVAAVAPDDGTSWRVSDVWCAVDCGTVVHLDSATAQIESGVMFGLSAALFEQVTIAQGAVSSRNFHTYRLARFEDAPDIHVALLPGTRPPAGLGEAGTPGIAPAVANALYRLTGERVRALPLRS